MPATVTFAQFYAMRNPLYVIGWKWHKSKEKRALKLAISELVGVEFAKTE